MPDADGVVGWAPAGAEGVDIGTADAAVGYFDVDVCRSERFGCEGAPFEVSLGGFGVVA